MTTGTEVMVVPTHSVRLECLCPNCCQEYNRLVEIPDGVVYYVKTLGYYSIILCPDCESKIIEVKQ